MEDTVVIYDIKTGEEKVRPMTPEEIADREQRGREFEAQEANRPAASDYGDDVPNDQERKMAEGVRSLRTYLQVASPNGAQTAAALKILIRIILFMLKRQGY